MMVAILASKEYSSLVKPKCHLVMFSLLTFKFMEVRAILCLDFRSLQHIDGQVKTGPGHAKMCFMAYVNNKGAYQPAHLCSQISTFVVRCLDNIICILALSKVSRF